MTESDCGSRRASKRQCARRSGAVPSAVHYVGYVEDDETPASIARKFEELDRIQAASRATARTAVSADHNQHYAHAVLAPDDGSLTEEQLMEVFKQTSIFTVSSAAENNESLLHHGRPADDAVYEEGVNELGPSEEDDLWDSDAGFWSDEDDDIRMDSKGRRARDRRRYGELLPRAARSRSEGGGKHRVEMVTHYNSTTQALIRRKVRVMGRDSVTHVKVPLPLPLSWGRTVQPYVPPQLLASSRNAPSTAAAPLQLVPPSCCIECPDLLAINWRRADIRKNYQALLINPGWVKGDMEGTLAAAALSQVPVAKLCPVGFVFIWADKLHLHAVVKQLYRWGFSYIENLTWVQMRPSNQLVALPSRYCRRSHSTLLIFRRTGVGKDIELRHQRNPDVIFDCVRSIAGGQGTKVPETVFTAIETLLPTGMGRFLELWATPGQKRPGWTHVCERLEADESQT